MRNLKKKFGEKVLQEFPQTIFKEYELQNKEIAKNFTKVLERLKDKNPEKRLSTWSDLSLMKDSSKMVIFWNAKEFLQFLKAEIHTEENVEIFKQIVKVVLNYLEQYTKSKNEFSFKNYFVVFQPILQLYYDSETKTSEQA